MILRELGPEDPVIEARVCIAAALFFLLYGINFKRISDVIQKNTGHSDRIKNIGITVMRPFALVMAAFALFMAYLLYTGRA